MTYRMGDSYLVDDETGLKIRRSDAVKRWDGLMVHRNVTNPRHPQDSVRGRVDRQIADVVRPKLPMQFIGPLTTTVSEPADIGAVRLRLDSAVRMLPGDMVVVLLEGGEPFRTTIASIVDADRIDLAQGLPRPVSAGAVLTNFTAMAAPAL